MTIGHNGGPPLAERGGWVKISRDMVEHYIVGAGQPVEAADKNRGSFSRLESWLDLLTLANWSERRIDNKGVVTILQPGQTLAGRSYLAKRWNWTEKTVRVWLTRLEQELMITLFCQSVHVDEQSNQGQTKGHTRNILTICNWDKFQSMQPAEGPDLGRPQGHPGATQGPQKKKGRREEDSIELPYGSMSAEADAPAPDEVSALEAFGAYNELAQRIGLPIARTLTPQRRKNLVARLREHGGMDAWRLALANVERSAFLRGGNSRQWRCDFDFLVTASRFAKVIDGTYGNGAHGDTLEPQESRHQRSMRLMQEAADQLSRRGLIP